MFVLSERITMDISAFIIICFVILIIVYVCKYMLTSNHNIFHKMGVECPPTSVLGHFHLGVKYGVFESQVQLYAKYKHKKVFGWLSFNIPAMVVCDLDLIKDVMVKHFNNFAERSASVEYEPPFRDILLNLKGDNWKRVRSIVSSTFSSGRIKRMTSHIQRKVHHLLDFIRQKQETGEEIELKTVCEQFTLAVIANIAFGLDVDCLSSPEHRFAKEALRVVKPNLLLMPLFLLLPKLKWIFSSLGLSIMAKKPMQYLVDAIDATMEERKRENTQGKINDFLDLVMNAEQDSVDANRKPLTRSELHAQSLVFVFAGLDTVSTVMSFTVFLLAVHPEACKKVQIELDQELGREFPDYDNVQKLDYLDMCINEAIRLAPPGFMIDRRCVDSVDINGVHFPKDMIVMIPVYAIHRDSDLWPEPDKFIPERFTEEEKNSRHSFAFLPFGQGPRNCIGLRLAMLELKVAIAALLQTFTPVPCSKTVYPFKLYKSFVRTVDGAWIKLIARK